MTTEHKTQGRVVELDRKDGEGAKGPWTMWRLKIEDESGSFWYSTFADEGRDAKMGQDFNVSYTLKDNPQNPQYPYRNITHLVPITAKEAGRRPPPDPRKVFGHDDEKTMMADHPAKRRSIERQVALSKAVELLTAYGDTAMMTPDQAMGWADQFATWIEGDHAGAIAMVSEGPSSPAAQSSGDSGSNPPDDYEPGAPDEDYA